MSISALSSGLASLYSARPQTAAPVAAHGGAHDGDGDDAVAAASAQTSQAASVTADRGKTLNIAA